MHIKLRIRWMPNFYSHEYSMPFDGKPTTYSFMEHVPFDNGSMGPLVFEVEIAEGDGEKWIKTTYAIEENK